MAFARPGGRIVLLAATLAATALAAAPASATETLGQGNQPVR